MMVESFKVATKSGSYSETHTQFRTKYRVKLKHELRFNYLLRREYSELFHALAKTPLAATETELHHKPRIRTPTRANLPSAATASMGFCAPMSAGPHPPCHVPVGKDRHMQHIFPIASTDKTNAKHALRIGVPIVVVILCCT